MTAWGWSKWRKHRVLVRTAKLRRHLPSTRWLGNRTFQSLLKKHRVVILKPAAKSGGFGVMKVASVDKHRISVHSDRAIRMIKGRSAIASFIKRTAARHYLVQKRIELATVNGCPFDLRVMVQRRRGGPWNVTGMVAKLAGRGYIITNVARSRGRVLTVSQALTRSGFRNSRAIRRKIRGISLLTAQKLSHAYPSLRTIGLDIGIDLNGKVWIIEANFRPMISLFRKLKNRSMYQAILRYTR
jgi:hypothetical protein